ncbi:hypothetical protein [Streptomyces sp. NPDC003247]|uniref:hypothetical protein n=1 Tax=Streptomyces sp. NPDC003247 TaxID=3364677 RepID=UPI003675F2F1
MTAPDSVTLHVLAENNLAAASPDPLRAMVDAFVADLTSPAPSNAPCPNRP